MSAETFPKLRQLDFQQIEYQGQAMWYLRDPLQLAENQLVLPPVLAQLTVYCDGRHDAAAIRHALTRQVGFSIPKEVVDDTLQALDEAYLLDNDRSRNRMAEVKAAYRAQPFRPMAHVHGGYPGDPDQLKAQFASYSNGDEVDTAWANWRGRAIISPHIDYHRGGNVYAQVWGRAAAAVQAADLVLMFATDHNGGYGSITLTPQSYATPYGIIPTDTALVDKLAQALGEEFVFDLELNHRQEHAVELSAVWLHHAAGGEAPPMLPILIGSFHHFVMNGHHPAEDEKLNTFIDTLVAETKGRNVLCVASVDLAHVGPAFQSAYVMDEQQREALTATDESLMEAVIQGDAARFYAEIAAVQDRNNVCGFSPIYLMLRYLNARGEGELSGHKIAYQHCPADAQNLSLVSICGLLLD